MYPTGSLGLNSKGGSLLNPLSYVGGPYWCRHHVRLRSRDGHDSGLSGAPIRWPDWRPGHIGTICWLLWWSRGRQTPMVWSLHVTRPAHHLDCRVSCMSDEDPKYTRSQGWTIPITCSKYTSTAPSRRKTRTLRRSKSSRKKTTFISRDLESHLCNMYLKWNILYFYIDFCLVKPHVELSNGIHPCMAPG